MMANIFDETLLTDRILVDLIESGETITGQLDGAARDMVDAAAALGVYDVPTSTGKATSSALQEYGCACAAVRILRDFWGVAHGESDIYREKLDYWLSEQSRRRQQLTAELIVGGVRSPQPSAYMAAIW